VKIYLDDLRTPSDNSWFIIRNHHDFIHKISTSFNQIECISFDHDLGEEKTGFDCAKYLIEYCMNNNLTPPQTYVHSANPVGRENIIYLINNYLTFIEEVPNCKWISIEHF
jgi:hypothetical protein